MSRQPQFQSQPEPTIGERYGELREYQKILTTLQEQGEDLTEEEEALANYGVQQQLQNEGYNV